MATHRMIETRMNGRLAACNRTLTEPGTGDPCTRCEMPRRPHCPCCGWPRPQRRIGPDGLEYCRVCLMRVFPQPCGRCGKEPCKVERYGPGAFNSVVLGICATCQTAAARPCPGGCGRLSKRTCTTCFWLQDTLREEGVGSVAELAGLVSWQKRLVWRGLDLIRRSRVPDAAEIVEALEAEFARAAATKTARTA